MGASFKQSTILRPIVFGNIPPYTITRLLSKGNVLAIFWKNVDASYFSHLCFDSFDCDGMVCSCCDHYTLISSRMSENFHLGPFKKSRHKMCHPQIIEH
mmetsp:Transcript_18395/g.23386  ORF Transcript_18395/g.23386 Transcript_18395/m.23386 type:complete len:99 (+) Transcript_18395:295-591(+)